MPADYLTSARQQFTMYKALGEKALAQVPDEALSWQPNSACNSMASIVKHMAGNMRSRWIEFLTSDGEKPWRMREAEFDNDLLTRAEVMATWEAGWQCLFTALDGLTAADLERTVYIRHEPHSVVEAINRQLAHYPSHVGQLLLMGKLVQGEAWQSLSIPRGGSAAFNEAKAAQTQPGS